MCIALPRPTCSPKVSHLLVETNSAGQGQERSHGLFSDFNTEMKVEYSLFIHSTFSDISILINFLGLLRTAGVLTSKTTITKPLSSVTLPSQPVAPTANMIPGKPKINDTLDPAPVELVPATSRSPNQRDTLITPRRESVAVHVPSSKAIPQVKESSMIEPLKPALTDSFSRDPISSTPILFSDNEYISGRAIKSEPPTAGSDLNHIQKVEDPRASSSVPVSSKSRNLDKAKPLQNSEVA